jgi:nitrogen regulatory protein P-II 1
MSELVEIRAIVRREMLDRVVHGLKDAGLPRLSAGCVCAIGAGVDPATTSISCEAGSEVTDKTMIQFLCARERGAMFVELIQRAAHTGRRGDGIVWVQPVGEVVNIRNGERGLTALV